MLLGMFLCLNGITYSHENSIPEITAGLLLDLREIGHYLASRPLISPGELGKRGVGKSPFIYNNICCRRGSENTIVHCFLNTKFAL
jgi:hypothetical protein